MDSPLIVNPGTVGPRINLVNSVPTLSDTAADTVNSRLVMQEQAVRLRLQAMVSSWLLARYALTANEALKEITASVPTVTRGSDRNQISSLFWVLFDSVRKAAKLAPLAMNLIEPILSYLVITQTRPTGINFK